MACNFIKKESLILVLFGEFCKISNNNIFTEHIWKAVLKNRNYPGIDIAGFNPGQTWVLFSYGFSKTQLTWIKSASSPTLPNLAGSFKNSKKLNFPCVCWVRCQSNKTYRAGFTSLWVLEPSQLTQATWFGEPSLPSLAGFVKKLDFSWVHLNK